MEKMKKYFACVILIFMVIFTIVACSYNADNTERVTFVGSKNSNIYHYTSCEWAQKINSSNLVEFSSILDAQSHGYRACNVCKPPRK